MAVIKWLPQAKYSVEQARALAQGAFFAVKDGGSVDDIGSAWGMSNARDGLRNSWGVTDSAGAQETLTRLLTGMHAPGFDRLLPTLLAARGAAPNVIQNHRTQLASVMDPDQASVWITVIQNTKILPPNLPSTTAAWDLTRLAGVCKIAISAGYVTEEWAWPMLMAGLTKARSHYGDWSSYGAGFILGRTLWAASGGIDDAEQYGGEAREIVDQLLTDPISPWGFFAW